LLPLIHQDVDKAAAQVRPVLASFTPRFHQAYMTMMGNKLGLTSGKPGDHDLIRSLLNLMEKKKSDYTVTFDRLTRSLTSAATAARIHEDLGEWVTAWQHRLAQEDNDPETIQAVMRAHNPVVIPRNHHMETVIRECLQSKTPKAAETFLRVLESPYKKLEHTAAYQDTPWDNDKDYQTFCGT
jgi:uncharacterized protein YdiU (UPF0061 family)